MMLATKLQEAAANSTLPTYIEDVFSTYLYTGNGSTQTITNGIDLSTKGGLVWLKGRSLGYNNGLFDTIRGADYLLCSNNTDPSTSVSGVPANPWITGFNSNGFGLGSNGSANANTQTYASWTFRKQPKFFDVVTYTGNGTTQNIAHNLGSVPGCIIVKEASAAGNDWQVYHRSTTNTCGRLFLNLTNAENANGRANTWGDNTNPVPPTSTVFTVGNTGAVNNNGATFVAYLFAHDAGGFGLTGTDNVITCGSFTTDGSGNATVNLGYEPQWVLYKRTSSTGNWLIVDNMRGDSANATNNANYLLANTSDAEGTATWFYPTATGFTGNANSIASTDFIYIAIRRGPMKVPTSGTSVFVPTIYYGNDVVGRQISTGSLAYTDTVILKRPQGNAGHYVFNRLTGDDYNWRTNSGDNAFNEPLWFYYDTMNGFKVGDTAAVNDTGDIYRALCFKRAPNFYDVIRYVGNGSARSLTHNLSAVPELVIIKSISGATNPIVYHSAVGNQKYLQLNEVATPSASSSYWNNQTPTDTTLFLGSSGAINGSSETYETHLFSTLAGVSKVGTYTGNGTSQTINCGFTGGARFVMIKAVGGTGNWLIADSASGITAGNDPYLKLNTINTEVTNEDWLDTDSTGFVVNEVAVSYANTSGIDYIFYAVA